MSSAPMAKLLPGVAGGFVAAYGFWTVMTIKGDQRLPHTIINPEWKEATKDYLKALPRHASDTPVAMNPSRYFS